MNFWIGTKRNWRDEISNNLLHCQHKSRWLCSSQRRFHRNSAFQEKHHSSANTAKYSITKHYKENKRVLKRTTRRSKILNVCTNVKIFIASSVTPGYLHAQYSGQRINTKPLALYTAVTKRSC